MEDDASVRPLCGHGSKGTKSAGEGDGDEGDGVESEHVRTRYYLPVVEWNSGTARRGDATAAAAWERNGLRRAGMGNGGGGGGGFAESLPGRRSSKLPVSGSSAMCCFAF